MTVSTLITCAIDVCMISMLYGT